MAIVSCRSVGGRCGPVGGRPPREVAWDQAHGKGAAGFTSCDSSRRPPTWRAARRTGWRAG
eukprot:1936758-Prymnesium_polylepis.1